MTRSDFVHLLGAGALCVAAGGCTPYVRMVSGTTERKRVKLSRGDVTELDYPHGNVQVKVDGLSHPVLLSRGETSEITALLLRCTHRGCEVRKSGGYFECPCHGSLFDPEGTVVSGPASESLVRYEVLATATTIEIFLDKEF